MLAKDIFNQILLYKKQIKELEEIIKNFKIMEQNSLIDNTPKISEQLIRVLIERKQELQKLEYTVFDFSPINHIEKDN